MSRYSRIQLIIFFGIFILIGVSIFFGYKGFFRFMGRGFVAGGGQKSLEQYAQDIVATCRKTSYHPSCYDKEIPKLMDMISMEDAFKVTQMVQAQDQTYAFCHVLGHELSAREVQKDPSRWKDVVTRCPSGTCSNGCIHGGFQERFRKESLSPEEVEIIKPDLTELCQPRGNWHPTGLEQGSCYHALGHLTMYLTNADIKKSTVLCGQITVTKDGGDFSRVCYDGAFMQIFQPLEPEDFALIKGKVPAREEISLFCGQFRGEQKGACFTESWPLFKDEIVEPAGLVRFCGQQESAQRDRCFTSLAYILTVQFQFDTGKLKTFCDGLPEERQGICFSNVSSRFIETDYRNISRAVEFCASAKESGAKEQCLNDLVAYSTFNFRAGSSEFLQLCGSLPAPWSGRCLAKNTQ